MCFLTDDTLDQQLSPLMTLYGTNTVSAVQKQGQTMDEKITEVSDRVVPFYKKLFFFTSHKSYVTAVQKYEGNIL